MSLPKALQNLFNKKIRTVGVVDVEAGDYVHGGGIVESVKVADRYICDPKLVFRFSDGDTKRYRVSEVVHITR
jgi:hypothetical protein